MLAAAGRALLRDAAPGGSTAADGTEHAAPGGSAADAALPLLVDVCGMLRPEGAAAAGTVPLLLAAGGCGPAVAARICATVSAWPAAGGDVSVRGVALAWGALQCLPHACGRSEEVSDWRTYFPDNPFFICTIMKDIDSVESSEK